MQPQNNFGYVMKIVYDHFHLPTHPIYCSRLSQKFGKTHHRRNAELKKRELMGYGGESGSMNIDCFKVQSYPNGVFGKKLLVLNSVCWMSPESYIEHIPSSWNKISIAIYHMYKTDCRLQETHINVSAAPYFQVQELGAKCLQQIWTKPLSNHDIYKHK